MEQIWIIFSANFGGNRSRDTCFRAKHWNANLRFKQLWARMTEFSSFALINKFL